MGQINTRLSTRRPLFMSRVKLKVTLTYFVTSVFSHVTRRYRQSRDSRELLISEVNVNHDHVA